MKIIYKKWSNNFKKLLDFEGDDNCEKLHNGRKLYYVVIYNDDDEPYCFLEINNTFLRVGFLDDSDRLYMDYIFEEYEAGKLFLGEAQIWDYEGDTDEKVFSTFYGFKQDGSLKIIKTDIRTREAEILDAKNKIDITANLDVYPEFGKYLKLIRIERGLKT
jgi:hypothetical protein